MVYEGCWDRAVHVIPRFEIPKDWPRYWSIDFGFTNPFAWAAYAEDPDGRLYLYKEIYYTKKTVAEHAKRILEVTKDEPKPKVIVCDHDAEDRATFSRETGLQTKPAWKAVSAGIQAVTERLKIAGDGKPRFFYLENSVADIDPELLQRHEPTCGDAEVEVYAWKRDATGLINKEEPEKRYDHGMDRDRYLITHVDQTWRRTLPMKTTVPILTRSGEQQDTELVQPSKWRFR
jgi:phage terminase large subunit